MTRYTPEFLAVARQGYENTDQPMRELARELGIGITTLSTLAETHGWAKRSQRKRGLPPAMQLLAEARALASRPGYSGESEDERERVAEPEDESPPPTLPLLEGASAPARPTLLDRMEQILEQLIAAEETAPANGIRSPQSARNLATLIQAMRALKGMRGNASTDTGPIEDNEDDDMPLDIDEFRYDLARRIDAFVASRTDAGDAVGNSGASPLDPAG